jgi:hypothetical protein
VRETVLVTGPSAGIGLELARLFAADGADLVLVARRAERLEALAKELEGRHPIRVHVLPRDLAAPGAATDLAEALRNRNLEVDVLVNNAGFGLMGAFHTLSPGRQSEMIRLNVSALTDLTRLLLPGMLARRRGGVLNVASTAGFQPGPNMAVYYATKAYVLSFTEALFEELRGSGVTVTCFCPGPTFTEFARVAGMEHSNIFRASATGAEKAARAGHRGFRRGKLIVIPGFVNRLGTLLAQIGPRWVVRKVARSLNS